MLGEDQFENNTGQMNGRIDGRTDERTDGQKERGTDGWARPFIEMHSRIKKKIPLTYEAVVYTTATLTK